MLGLWILAQWRAAPASVLIRGTAAAVKNAQDLLDDAQVLAQAGRSARAYSLAALAFEEAGKASGLVLIAVMPERLRARAPVDSMLEWHQLKQVQGLWVAKVPYRMPEVAPLLAALPAGELAQILSSLDAPADEADRLKRRGLYVDVGRAARSGSRRRSPRPRFSASSAGQDRPRQRRASCSSPSCKPSWSIRRPKRSSSHGRRSARLLKSATPALQRLPPT